MTTTALDNEWRRLELLEHLRYTVAAATASLMLLSVIIGGREKQFYSGLFGESTDIFRTEYSRLGQGLAFAVLCLFVGAATIGVMTWMASTLRTNLTVANSSPSPGHGEVAPWLWWLVTTGPGKALQATVLVIAPFVAVGGVGAPNL